MKQLPSISNEINEDVIFKIISKNFSKIAPYWFELLSSWLIRSYNVFQDIDKYIILVYLINKDLIFFRKNGLIIEANKFLIPTDRCDRLRSIGKISSSLCF